MKRYYPTYTQSIGLILLMIPIGVVSFLILAVLHFAEGPLTILGIYSVVLSLTIVAGLNTRKDFSFSMASFPISLLIIAFAFLMSFHLVIEPLTSSIPPPEGLEKAFSEMIQMPIIAFITIVLLAPLLEELLFRGIILDGYLKNYSPINSIVVSAFLFALIHGNLAQGIGAFMMGVVAGLLYWRTKSLLLCIALHFSNNFTAFLAMMADPENMTSEATLRQLIDNDGTYYIIYAMLCLLLATTSWYLWDKYLKPARELLTKKPVIYSDDANKDQI